MASEVFKVTQSNTKDPVEQFIRKEHFFNSTAFFKFGPSLVFQFQFLLQTKFLKNAVEVEFKSMGHPVQIMEM